MNVNDLVPRLSMAAYHKPISKDVLELPRKQAEAARQLMNKMFTQVAARRR